MLFTPIVFWGGLIYGLGITYLGAVNLFAVRKILKPSAVLFAVTVSIIFSEPPYNFSAASVGLTYIGPLIAAFIATLLAGPLTSACARVLSKRNKGIFEPEFKLLPVILYAIFGVMGFVGFGMVLQRGTLTMALRLFPLALTPPPRQAKRGSRPSCSPRSQISRLLWAPPQLYPTLLTRTDIPPMRRWALLSSIRIYGPLVSRARTLSRRTESSPRIVRSHLEHCRPAPGVRPAESVFRHGGCPGLYLPLDDPDVHIRQEVRLKFPLACSI